MIGQIVGNYEVVAKIGEGGMGAVYKGVDLMLEREVAIKALRPELGNQPQIVERFRSEAVTLAKLNHPNIATLYSFFRQGDFFFMVMEYVRGVTVDKVMEPGGAMSCQQAVPLFCQALEGIDHAHRFGIVHRDIKPSNMMLTDSGLLKVLDFGIARVLGTSRLTKAGGLIGTIEYMSPEQVRGLETDARSDIYSLGILLYEMLTGRVPFTSDNEFELMRAQVEQPPTRPRELVPSIPEDVEWAILCATEKDPAKRFQTAAAFRSAIVNSMGPLGNVPKMDLPRSGPSIVPISGTGGQPASHGVIYTSSSPDTTTSNTSPGNQATYIDAQPEVPTNRPSASDSLIRSNSQPGARTRETTSSNPGNYRTAEPDGMHATRLAEGIVHLSAGHSTGSSSGEIIRGTRLVDAGSVPLPAQSYSPAGSMSGSAATSPSFFSKLTWKHYAAAAVAFVFLLVVVIAIPLGIWISGSAKDNKAESPAGEGPSSVKSDKPMVVEAPPTNASPTPVVTQGGVAPSGPAVGQNPAIPFIPPQPAETPKSAAPQRVASKPSRQPQKTSESGPSGADRDRARRRAEALKALDQ